MRQRIRHAVRMVCDDPLIARPAYLSWGQGRAVPRACSNIDLAECQTVLGDSPSTVFRCRLALLHSDIVNSTQLNLSAGDALYYDLRRDHDAIVRACLARHAGKEFKHHGDGVDAWFSDATLATRCGLEMHKSVESLTRDWLDLPLQLRIGIVAGEVTATETDVHGINVVRAVRVCASAQAGELLVGAEVAADLRYRDGEFSVESLGPQMLKHFPEPELLFRLS